MPISASADHIERHTKLGNDYRSWKHTAQALFAGSKILNRERERVRSILPPPCKAPMEMLTTWTELMLTAFGIECLVKVIWTKRGNQVV
jgi:hypothetical protein